MSREYILNCVVWNIPSVHSDADFSWMAERFTYRVKIERDRNSRF